MRTRVERFTPVCRFPSARDIEHKLLHEENRQEFLRKKRFLEKKLNLALRNLVRAEEAYRAHLSKCPHPEHWRTPQPVLREFFYQWCKKKPEWCHDCLKILAVVPD